MPQTTKIHELGFRQAKVICNMDSDRRLRFIADGLPILAESARSLMEASQRLGDFPREAEVLEGHAVEECAKALILFDIVRCPPSIASARCGSMMDWFYNHQSRLLFAEAQQWVAYTPEMLQGYADDNRESHYLEGGLGEYILPNWEAFRRESTLYADAMGNLDEEPTWHSPVEVFRRRAEFGDLTRDHPHAYTILDALDAVGAFKADGVQIVHEVWSKRDFTNDVQAWDGIRDIVVEMLEKLNGAGLVTDRVEVDHYRTLFERWQKPMYFAELSPIKVTLEEMKRRQDAILAYEISY